MRSPRSRSVAFDRAAALYDRTRSLSREGLREVVSVLSSELRERGRCLEIGVGTGRVALPLAQAGIPVAGVDLSRPMIDRLVEKAGGRAPFPLAVADATMLPFPDRSFGAALAAHVLHLIPAWREAVAELVRVVQPSGVVLVLVGRWPHPFSRVYERFAEEAGPAAGYVGLGMDRLDELDAAFSRFGAGGRGLRVVVDRREGTVDGFLRQLDENVFSCTWSLDEETRRGATAATRDWAAREFGALEKRRLLEDRIAWRAYDLP